LRRLGRRRLAAGAHHHLEGAELGRLVERSAHRRDPGGDLVQALENGDAVLEDRPLGMGGQRQREERGAGRRRARPPHGSPPPWLKIMWPIRSSRLTADWVSVTSSPGSSISMSPPGTSARYLP